MKLNRRALRKMILNEIKALNEGFEEGEISADRGKIVFGNFTYQVKTSGIELPVKKLKVLPDGTVSVSVKTPYVPFISDGSVKSGKITDNLNTLKSSLSKGIPFTFNMKDDKGEDVKLNFETI